MSLVKRLRVLAMFTRLLGRAPIGHLWYLWRRLANEKPHRFGGLVRINSFFPPYPSVAFDRFCRAVVNRARTPYSTYLAVTGRCPYRCEHCSYAGRKQGELATSQWLGIIEQVRSLGTAIVGFTGGEPLLRGDLEELVAAARPEMATILFTTGHGLDGQRARRLAEGGLANITIGIESADPAEHDRIRGVAGSFAEAESAVRAAHQAGLYVALSTVGTRARLADGQLDRMYELAERWGASEFRLLSPVATGGWAGCAAAMLTAGELSALAEFHARRNRESDGPAVTCFAYLESDAMFGCGAGFHHLFIDATGEVCPCDLTPLSFGNAAEEVLAEIWGRMGRWFARPRCGCLMGRLALPDRPDELPIPRERSEALCPRPAGAEPLPEVYRRLFKARK